MKGHYIVYTGSELAWIRAHSHWPRPKTHAAFCAKFGRPEVSVSNIASLCKRKGWLTGRTGYFTKGQEPFNKGKQMPFHPNSAATRFKKGDQPHNTNYLGHQRVSKDGYVEVSIAETNPHTGFERRYVLKHRHEWEKANGKIPKGHALKCLDGNKQNTVASNWEAVPRAILPILAGGRAGRNPYDQAPAELKPTILLLAKTKHRLRKVTNTTPHDTP